VEYEMKRTYIFSIAIVLFVLLLQGVQHASIPREDMITFKDMHFEIYRRNLLAIEPNIAITPSMLYDIQEIFIYNSEVSDVHEIVHMPFLNRITIANTKLKHLDVSNHIWLYSLVCPNNELETLLLPNSGILRSLDCRNNKLADLDLRPSGALSSIIR
jgi:Leucine-rich repeat (LRR) protein